MTDREMLEKMAEIWEESACVDMPTERQRLARMVIQSRAETQHWIQARRNAMEAGEIMKSLLDAVRKECDDTISAHPASAGNPTIHDVTGFGKVELAKQVLEILNGRDHAQGT